MEKSEARGQARRNRCQVLELTQVTGVVLTIIVVVSVNRAALQRFEALEDGSSGTTLAVRQQSDCRTSLPSETLIVSPRTVRMPSHLRSGTAE